MNIPKIHEGEYRFCLIMWAHEPVTAVQLVKLCQEQLGWKKSTTYTVIKRLGERGVLENNKGILNDDGRVLDDRSPSGYGLTEQVTIDGSATRA